MQRTSATSSPAKTSASPARQSEQLPKSLEERFAEITTKMGTLDLAINPNDPSSLIKAKSQLDDIISDLELFVEGGLTEGTTDKSKALLAYVAYLLSQTNVLRGHIAKKT